MSIGQVAAEGGGMLPAVFVTGTAGGAIVMTQGGGYVWHSPLPQFGQSVVHSPTHLLFIQIGNSVFSVFFYSYFDVVFDHDNIKY